MSRRNPFEHYQREHSDRRLSLVKEALSAEVAKGARYDLVTRVAEVVASHVADKEGSPCFPSTVLRNPIYRLELDKFMLGSEKPAQDARDLSDPRAKILLVTAELRVGKLQRDSEELRVENQRLKRHLAELATAATDATGQSQETKHASRLPRQAIDAALTCRALYAVLRHFTGLVEIDAQAKRIMDVTAFPRRTLVDEATAKPFFEWFRSIGEADGKRD